MRPLLSGLLASSVCALVACSSENLPTQPSGEATNRDRPEPIGGSDPCLAAYGSFVWQVCHSYRMYDPWWQPGLGYDCGIQCTTTFAFAANDSKWADGVSVLQASAYFSCQEAGNRLASLIQQGLVNKWIPYDYSHSTGNTLWAMTINTGSGTTVGMQFWNGAWSNSGYRFFQFLMAHEAYHSLNPWTDEQQATDFANMCLGTNYGL